VRAAPQRGVTLPVLAALFAVAIALLVVAKPLRAPWWVNADPDGTYIGSSLNILLGNHTSYLDHPGIVDQDALALAFGAEYLVDKARGTFDTPEAFADARMLDLDGTRWTYRTLAILFDVGGVLLAFALVWRLLGHWTWGLAAALLFVATPGIALIATLLRPDALVSALALAVGYALATAFERRSPARYASAAALFGVAMMTKLTVVGLAAPLALAALWRPPAAGWPRALGTAAWDAFRRHRIWLVPAAAAWLVICLRVNRERLPVLTNDDQRHVLAYGGTLLAGFFLCVAVAGLLRLPWASRLFSAFNCVLLVAFVAGLFLPASLILDDGIQAVYAIWDSLTGGRVNENVDAFSQVTVHQFLTFPFREAAIVILLAVVAAVVGARRRVFWPLLLALGGGLLAVEAAARYSVGYYYAPAYAVSVPAALWVLRRREGGAVPVHGWLVVAAVLGPLFFHLPESPGGDVRFNAAAQRIADGLLHPGEVILTPGPMSIEDLAFDAYVDGFADHVPAYPYRFLPVSELPRLGELGLTPRYYTAPALELPVGSLGRVELDGRSFTVRRLPVTWGPDLGVVRILRETH
jgi:hypothetical protein